MFNSAKEEIRLTLLTLALFSSAFVAFAYGMAVLVGLAYGADDADPLRSFLICLFLGAAFLPFASASSLFIVRARGVFAHRLHAAAVWTVAGLAAALGIYQVVVDPGDAIVFAAPLIVFAVTSALSLRAR